MAKQKKGRRSTYLLLAAVLSLLLLINLTGGGRDLTPVEDGLLTIIAPIQQLFSSLGKKIQSFVDALLLFQALRAENERLLQENSFLEKQLLYLQELQKENHRYRSLLDFMEGSELELLPARVVARDPSQWFGTITVNRGYLDQVQREMAVVTAQGLVGMVSTVSSNSCQVILLTDPRLAVSAVVQRSRETGVVGIVENFPDAPAYLHLTNLPREANIQPGDEVITSGLGGIFPRGLYIGTVKEVGEDQFGLVLSAVIQPKVNFNRLEEVLIVLGGTESGDAVFEEPVTGAEEAGTGEDGAAGETEGGVQTR